MRTGSPPRPRTAAAASSACEPLEQRRLFASVSPAADEQLFIELLNRARANPPQFAIDFGLSVPLTDAAAKPPLAVNGFLTDSSGFKAQEMADNNYFDHLSAVTGKYANQLAREAGYTLPGFYPNNTNNIESLSAGRATPIATLKSLLEDTGTNPPGHRIHLLGMDAFFGSHKEVGIGHGFNLAAQYDDYWAAHTGVDPDDSTFVTGVAYTDAVTDDDFYTIGEGIGGATITAVRVGGGAGGGGSTTTFASGGYSLKLAASTYNITASGAGFASPVTFANVVVGTSNVKRDFVGAGVVAPAVVQSVSINGGAAQRSRVTSLTVTFDKAVALDAGAFTVVGRAGAGAGTTASFANPLGDGRTFVVSFAGAATAGGSLADGVHDFTVVAAKVHAGSAAGPAMAANATRVLHRLFGDDDGDGDVDALDLFQLRSTVNKSTGNTGFKAHFDYDGLGTVDNADLLQLRSRMTVSFKGYT